MEPGWVHLTDNFKRLAQYAPSHSVYTVSATGAVFHRLSVGGFDGYADAASLCNSLRQQGADCFVRREGGDRPMQMAGGKRQQFARSEEHTSELQSLIRLSYAVFCLKKIKKTKK